MTVIGLMACGGDSGSGADSDGSPGPLGARDELGFTAITRPEGDGAVLLGSGDDEVRLRDVDGFCDAYGRTRTYLDDWVSVVEAGDEAALRSFISERNSGAMDVADRISTNATNYNVGKRPSSAVYQTWMNDFRGTSIEDIAQRLESSGPYDSLGEFETFFEAHC